MTPTSCGRGLTQHAVKVDEDRRLVAMECPVPEPGPGQAVVEVFYCGICGSDLLQVAHSPHCPNGSKHPLLGCRGRSHHKALATARVETFVRVLSLDAPRQVRERLVNGLVRSARVSSS